MVLSSVSLHIATAPMWSHLWYAECNSFSSPFVFFAQPFAVANRSSFVVLGSKPVG